MRVLIVNTSERVGGAAVAANRLMEALCNNGVKAKMLVREKQTEALTVSGLPQRWRAMWHFLWERLVVWLHLRLRYERVFELDIANCGTDITTTPEFREADVVHLHWVNQGMLSLKDIRRILDSGKPVVWTMHDLWPATAICHYDRGCNLYQTECTRCPQLPSQRVHGLANRVWRGKQHMLDGHHVTFVACSRWLAGEARSSALLRGQKVVDIPNPIDTRQFRRTDKGTARQALGLPADRHVILFVSQRVTEPRKGMDYFVQAVRLLAEEQQMRQQAVVAILGGHAEEVASQLALPVYPLGYVSDPHRIVEVYNAADVFVLPSLEDNLPNTIMEAMACGVPCVGFNVGGIPEMVDHKQNGYVAQERQAADLAAGMRYVLSEADYSALSTACVQKVVRNYSQQSVASRYIAVYQELLNKPQTEP